MAIKRFWCARLLVLRGSRPLGRKAFCVFPAHSDLSFATTSAVFRATGKISSGPLNCFYFTGFLPEPSWPICLPSTTLPTHFPNQTHCPHPQIPLQLYYKQTYLSNFKNFGSKKTLGQLSWGKVGMLVLHIAVEPIPVSSQRCTSSHNPIQSTKQVHKPYFTDKSRLRRFLPSKTVSNSLLHTVW